MFCFSGLSSGMQLFLNWDYNILAQLALLKSDRTPFPLCFGVGIIIIINIICFASLSCERLDPVDILPSIVQQLTQIPEEKYFVFLPSSGNVHEYK